jgi:hypothetical protein
MIVCSSVDYFSVTAIEGRSFDGQKILPYQRKTIQRDGTILLLGD